MDWERAWPWLVGAGVLAIGGYWLWRQSQSQGIGAPVSQTSGAPTATQSQLTFDSGAPATDWLDKLANAMNDEAPQSGVNSVSVGGVDAIKQAEGLRLTAYPDANGYSIGYGHFGASQGQTITLSEADALFDEDLAKVEEAINGEVKVPLSQNQYDALADFVFNVGVGAFEGSTLLSLLNQGDYAGAAAQFSRWKYSGQQVDLELVARRAEEQQTFSG